MPLEYSKQQPNSYTQKIWLDMDVVLIEIANAQLEDGCFRFG